MVITNIDDDHLDYYKDLDDIESAFSELAGQIKPGGSLVCDLELPHVDNVAKKILAEENNRGKNKRGRTVVDYNLFGDQNLKLKVPGQHNLNNAAAALSVADLVGVHRAAALESMANFHGTWRRFEYRGQTPEGALVYDDYGHHPTEIKATLEGAREMFPNHKIFVVFQSHLYSRTKQHLKEFGQSFKDADDVTIAPIYPAREPFDPSITSAMIVAEIEKNAKMGRKNLGSAKNPTPVRAAPNFNDIFADLRARTKSGDVIITIGAGDINELADRFVAR